jgi:hypothetical protein
MVLTRGCIKVITNVIASQVITDLKKPLKKSFIVVESVRLCEEGCSDKDTLIDYFKDHERRTHEEIDNESMKN